MRTFKEIKRRIKILHKPHCDKCKKEIIFSGIHIQHIIFAIINICPI